MVPVVPAAPAADQPGPPRAERPVTIAVISWNTRELLIRCLRSLLPEVEAHRAEVWVVDNGSSDGSAAAVREHAPWAEVVEPGTNLGFGPAVNLIARATDTEWLAVANADVALEPGALEALLATGGDDRVGCVAPRLLLPDGSSQHSVHSLPTIPFTLALNAGLYRLSARLADSMLLDGFYDADRVRDVPWAIGAFLLLRRSAFDEVGGFDEGQWMYAEDLDLGWRLRERGWVTRYQPGARVRHASGAATVLAFGDDRTRRFTRETYAVIARRRGRARAWLIAVVNVIGAGTRVAWMTPAALIARRLQAPRDLSKMWLGVHLQGLRLQRSDRERG